MNNKLPWEAYFYGTIEKRTIRDAERHTVNVCDAACAEFIVAACNAYEANQAEIKQLQEKLELCREAIEKATDDLSYMLPCEGYFENQHGKSAQKVLEQALEAIEGRDGE